MKINLINPPNYEIVLSCCEDTGEPAPNGLRCTAGRMANELRDLIDTGPRAASPELLRFTVALEILEDSRLEG